MVSGGVMGKWKCSGCGKWSMECAVRWRNGCGMVLVEWEVLVSVVVPSPGVVPSPRGSGGTHARGNANTRARGSGQVVVGCGGEWGSGR